jgi:hypothetical protein
VIFHLTLQHGLFQCDKGQSHNDIPMVGNEIVLVLEHEKMLRCVFMTSDLLEKIQVSWHAFMIFAAQFVQTVLR